MRNLKRALSLALASVMLLGMMVVGTSAAFADADEIVNTEAVEITAGLGLFAGSDGKFNPKGNVTRAQMATVIVKMLYGSEINADQYKGIAKFNDVAAFEGGWAEGYVNLCANLGIVGGYGDGSFKPGNSVTTAEAVTMIINALGVDAGKGTWPLTVMAKAEEMKLFEELAVKPATNVALTRDQLASVVLEGLKYSPAGNNGYSVTVGNKTFTFDNIADALAAAGNDLSKIDEVVGEDTLAKTVFEMTSVTGFVTANQATGEDYTVVDGVALALESGLDMIGHYVTAYYAEEYKSEAKPGKAYCIVDEAEYIAVAEEIDEDRKAFNSAFGTKELTYSAAGARVDDAYWTYVFSGKGESVLSVDEYDYDAKSATPGTYVVYEGTLIGYIQPAAKTVVEIGKVTTAAGRESIRINGKSYDNTADNDEIVEYEGIAQEDIAIMVTAQNMVVVSKVEKFEGQVSKTGTDVDGNEILTIDGKAYVINASVTNSTTLLDRIADIGTNFEYTYAFYTVDGKIVAFEEVEGNADLGDIVYVVGTYATEAQDAYGNNTISAYAQVVDLQGKESSLLIGIDYASESKDDLGVDITKAGDVITVDFDATGFQVFKLSKKNADEKKAGIMVVEEDAVKTAPETGKATIFADSITSAFDAKTTKFYPNTNDDYLAFTSDATKYVLIDGAPGKTLDVAVMTGSVKLAAHTYDVILSADKNGEVTVSVVVYVADEMVLPSADLMYISAAQIEGASTVADGVEMEVYFVADKKFETIIVDAAPEADGFYDYTYDSIEKVYSELEIKNTVIDDNDTEEDTSDDFIAAGNQIFYGEKLKNIYGGKSLISSNIAGLDATEAAVIDARSAKELEKSDFAKVEDLADLAALVSSDIDVYMDVMLDDDDQETVVVIVVTYVDEHKFEKVGNEDGTHTEICETCSVAGNTDDCTFVLVDNENGTHTEICTVCGDEGDTDDCAYVGGKCACGAEEPEEEPV